MKGPQDNAGVEMGEQIWQEEGYILSVIKSLEDVHDPQPVSGRTVRRHQRGCDVKGNVGHLLPRKPVPQFNPFLINEFVFYVLNGGGHVDGSGAEGVEQFVAQFIIDCPRTGDQCRVVLWIEHKTEGAWKELQRWLFDAEELQDTCNHVGVQWS